MGRWRRRWDARPPMPRGCWSRARSFDSPRSCGSSRMRDRNPLLRVAGHLADGGSVEWDREAAEQPELSEELESLRMIERISRVFAATGDSPTTPMPPSDHRRLARQLEAALSDRYAFGRV